MAIDTRAKRESAVKWLAPGIHPDGVISASDRVALLDQYSGILSSPPPSGGQISGNLRNLAGRRRQTTERELVGWKSFIRATRSVF